MEPVLEAVQGKELTPTHAGDQLQATHPIGNEPEWHQLYGAWYREVS